MNVWMEVLRHQRGPKVKVTEEVQSLTEKGRYRWTCTDVSKTLLRDISEQHTNWCPI